MVKLAKMKLPNERYDICVTFTTRKEVVRIKGSYTAPQNAEIKKVQDLPLIVQQN